MAGKNQTDFDLPMVFQDTEIIADPLNKLISISKFEKRIICCPEFQRLRRIKQLGFAHFVYPAAEYSRFVHSVGVCHQAKFIVDTINQNLQNNRRYQKWRLYGRENEKPIGDNVFISPFERVIIAAAGLLHDLPHGPFSHEIEGILTETGENVIPDHDKLADNPALFLYLFDKEVSEIALLLEYFNAEFFQALFKYFKDAVPKLSQDWRESLARLCDKNVLTEAGMLKIGVKGSPIQFTKKGGSNTLLVEKFKELPFLSVAIFEILLFEKQDEWLSPNETKNLFKGKHKQSGDIDDIDWGLIVKPGWVAEGGIRWQPMPGWFRAYRKDIIGNTICADLIDYVNRDGHHTGIVSTMDLKFLDRMTIVRAVLPPTGNDGQRALKPPANTINYEDIPFSCEHVVFDIYDHKRGFIRQSVLTEILAYLQARYLLCERVYNHRVVEAARSMLQKIIFILSNIKTENGSEMLLTVKDLHPLNKRGPGDPLAPTGDDAFLNWVRSLREIRPDVYKKNSTAIDDAIELATLIQERRIFREAVIYDGLHGFLLPGKLGGPEVSCRALEAAFLTSPKITPHLNKCLQKIDQYLSASFEKKTKNVSESRDRLTPRIKCLVGIRKWGKRYKPPLVLVSRPLKQPEAEHGSFDVEPLLDCADPGNIKKQLDALKSSYDSLWKVYLFLHPVFHGRLFLEEHIEVNRQLDDFAAKHTGERWNNAIEFRQLLTEALDNVIFLAQAEKSYFEKDLVPASLNSVLKEFTRVVTEIFPTAASQFSDLVETEGFQAKVRQELLQAVSEKQLWGIVNEAPRRFRKYGTENPQGESQLTLAARESETYLQNLAVKAIIEARQHGSKSQAELNLGEGS